MNVRSFCLMIVLCFNQIYAADKTFSLATWNILGIKAPDLASYNFSGSKFKFLPGDSKRFDTTADFLNRVSADVIALQEISEKFTLDPTSAFVKNFDYSLASYVQKGKNGGVALYLKKNSKMSVISHGHVENMGHGACAWALFEDAEKHRILIGSVQLARNNGRDGADAGNAQWDAIGSVLKPIVDKNKCAVILAGDFNTYYEEVLQETQYYIGEKLHASVEMYQHCSWTANGNIHFDFYDLNKDLSAWGGNDCYEFCSVDHVIYSDKMLKIRDNQSWVYSPKNEYKDAKVIRAKDKVNYDNLGIKSKELIHKLVPSDHLPVFVSFNFIETAKQSTKGSQKDFLDDEMPPLKFLQIHRPQIQLIIDGRIASRDDLDVSLPNKNNVGDWMSVDPADPGGFSSYLNDHYSDRFRQELSRLVGELINERKNVVRAMFKSNPAKNPMVPRQLAQALELALCL